MSPGVCVPRDGRFHPGCFLLCRETHRVTRRLEGREESSACQRSSCPESGSSPAHPRTSVIYHPSGNFGHRGQLDLSFCTFFFQCWCAHLVVLSPALQADLIALKFKNHRSFHIKKGISKEKMAWPLVGPLWA